MEYLFNDVSQLENSVVDTNAVGEKSLHRNGELLATQKHGMFPNTTVSMSEGQQIAETKENVINGTDIIQEGKQTGVIKEDVMGNLSLYDTNQGKVAYIDSNGNVKSVMSHADPLSQVDRVNFQELKFHSE